jgi:hypothetical protein
MSHQDLPGTAISVTVSPQSSSAQKVEVRDPRDQVVARLLVKLTAADTATLPVSTTIPATTANDLETKNRALSVKHGLDDSSVVMCWFNVQPTQCAGVISQYLMSAKKGAKTDKGIPVEGYSDWRQILELRQSKHINELYFEHPARPASRIRLPSEPSLCK